MPSSREYKPTSPPHLEQRLQLLQLQLLLVHQDAPWHLLRQARHAKRRETLGIVDARDVGLLWKGLRVLSHPEAGRCLAPNHFTPNTPAAGDGSPFHARCLPPHPPPPAAPSPPPKCAPPPSPAQRAQRGSPEWFGIAVPGEQGRLIQAACTSGWYGKRGEQVQQTAVSAVQGECIPSHPTSPTHLHKEPLHSHKPRLAQPPAAPNGLGLRRGTHGR